MLEDAELGDADQFSGGVERRAGGGDGVVDLSGSDGVVVLRIGVLASRWRASSRRSMTSLPLFHLGILGRVGDIDHGGSAKLL